MNRLFAKAECLQIPCSPNHVEQNFLTIQKAVEKTQPDLGMFISFMDSS